MMTLRAAQLGMTHSTFTNSNGWPQAGHRMSMRDLALLSNLLISEFPEFYPMFAETEFLFDEKEASNRFNRNPLLGLGIGADGLKTGHTQEAGYGLAGSARQGDRRVTFVLSGIDTAERRAQEAEAVVNWAFRHFARRDLGKAGTQLARAPVWMGAENSVGLVLAEDLTALMPVLSPKDVPAEVVFTGPVSAPVAKGQELAQLVLTPDGLPELRVPLVADRDVPRGGFMTRIATAANTLLMRLQNGPEGAM